MTGEVWAAIGAIVTAIAGAAAAIVRAYMSRPKRISRPSPELVAPPPTLGHVTHAELTHVIGDLRTELHARIEATDADCDRGREELARRQDEHFRALAGDVKELSKEIGKAIGAAEERRSRR